MRIKYGGGAGHNQSLQNYQRKQGGSATLGKKVQTGRLGGGRGGDGEAGAGRLPPAARGACRPRPAPRAGAGTRASPAEPYGDRGSRRGGSVSSERPWRSLCCKMSPPRPGSPSGAPPPHSNLWIALPLASPKAVATPGTGAAASPCSPSSPPSSSVPGLLLASA